MMSYKLGNQPRAHPSMRNDPRNSLSSSSLDTRANARMSRQSGSTQDQGIIIVDDEDNGNETRATGSRATGATANNAKQQKQAELIDLTTPSPPGSRATSRVPQPSTATGASSSKSRRKTPNLPPPATRATSASKSFSKATEPVASSPKMGSFHSQPSPAPAGPIVTEASSARASRASLRRKANSAVASPRASPVSNPQRDGTPPSVQDDPMEIDETTPRPPQIKKSPPSKKRKRAEVDAPSQGSSSGDLPMVLIPTGSGEKTIATSTRSSRRTTPQSNHTSKVNSRTDPKVKLSPHTLPIQSKKNARQPEIESDSEQAAEIAAKASTSHQPSQSDSEGAPSASPSPEKSQDVSPAHSPPRVSTRNKRVSQQSTIGSSSPLVPRLQARRQRGQVSNAETSTSASPRPDLEDDEASHEDDYLADSFSITLRTMDRDMHADHASHTRYILQKAREQSQAAPSIALDKVSPWANMKSVSIDNLNSVSGSSGEKSGSVKNKGKASEVSERMDSWVMSKSGKWITSKSYQRSTTITGHKPRLPKFCSHTHVDRNFLSADNEKLKYVPYMGHDAEKSANHELNLKKLLKDLQEAYSNGRIGSTRHAELASRLSDYLNMWFAKKKIDLDREVLVQYIISQEEAPRLGLREDERDSLLASFSEPLSERAEEAAGVFWDAFNKSFQIPLPNVLLPLERLKEMVEVVTKKPSTSPEKAAYTPGDRLGTYASLTCLMCGSVDCQTHVDYSHDEIPQSGGEQLEPEYFVQRQPIVLPYNDMMRRHNVRKKARLESENGFELPKRPRKKNPCSETCWRLDSDHPGEDIQWGSAEETLLEELFIGVTDKDRACQIALALGLPCWKVYSKLEGHVQEDDTPMEAEEPSGRAKRPDWYDNKRKTLHHNFVEMTQVNLHQERSQANPCAHKGHCTSKCPCFEADILCESTCGCADDCPRRFTGCSCLGNGLNCVSETCICIQMNRECGPECISCGAVERINPFHKYNDELFTWGCQNVSLQRGVLKKTVAGESQLVGFGLYVAEPVRKGEFISEYKGEVISGQEAERRGIIYDRKYVSFLFDLNRDYVIDAARYGNDTRFINHADSERNGLNCEAKIILVNGEHRIKFVALRDIKVGEELLFNYGKKFAEKHGLSKKLPKTADVGKNGILPEGALRDALDGVDARQNSVRGKIAAVRGRPKGSRGKHTKMRKSASSARQTVVEESESLPEPESQETQDDMYTTSQEVDEDDDEEDEEEPITEGRVKRQIKRPARYTR